MNLIFFKESLERLDFQPLDNLYKERDFDFFEQVLYNLAFNPESGESNLFVYTYMLRLINSHNNWRIHLSISRLMGVILNHLDGAELIGLYHALEANKLKPMDENILEIILYYNHIPEKILNDSDANIYSSQLLKINPLNKIARRDLY